MHICIHEDVLKSSWSDQEWNGIFVFEIKKFEGLRNNVPNKMNSRMKIWNGIAMFHGS